MSEQDSKILATPLRASVVTDTELFAAYTGRDDFVSKLIGRYDLDAAGWKARFAVDAGASLSTELASHLRDYNAGLGIAPDLLERLEMAARGEARFVVTGQQPGALGGPLMALHKAAATIALARRLESMTGVVCIPLFWIGADDSDFPEIREAVVPGTDLQALAAAIGTDHHDVGMSIGAIPTEAIARLWTAIEPFVSAHPGGAFVSNVVASSIAHGADHGAVSAEILSKLSGGRIALVDGRSAAIRESAKELILDYFDREDEMKSIVSAQGESLDKHGYHAQLRPGKDSGLFVLDKGRRHTVTEATREGVREQIAADISKASPGVILRNLIQDAVFSPVVVLLGPAEIAYRSQIVGVYEALGVPMPVAFPRLFASFVPPAIADVARECGVAADTLASDVVAFKKAVFEAESDPAAKDAADHFRASFVARTKEFVETAGHGMPDKEREKLTRRLDDVSRRLDKVLESTASVGKTRALERWRFLAGIDELFFRKGLSQERYLSMITPFLFGDDGAMESVIAAADVHVEASLDGRLLHVVYSS